MDPHILINNNHPLANKKSKQPLSKFIETTKGVFLFPLDKGISPQQLFNNVFLCGAHIFLLASLYPQCI
jgi:hypothetical protein